MQPMSWYYYLVAILHIKSRCKIACKFTVITVSVSAKKKGGGSRSHGQGLFLPHQTNLSPSYVETWKLIERCDVNWAYQVLVRPKLEYCSTAWDPHSEDQIHSVEKIQQRAARYTYN